MTLSCRGALVSRTSAHGVRVVGCGGMEVWAALGGTEARDGAWVTLTAAWTRGLGGLLCPSHLLLRHIWPSCWGAQPLSFPARPPPTTRGLASEHGCSAACLLWGSHTGVSGDGGFHLGPQGSGLGQSGRTGGGGGDAAWSRAGLAGPRPWGSECTWVKEPVRDDSALGCNCQTPLTLLRLYVTSG